MANEFDLAERERIRAALLAYMKEHGIGTTRLAARIKASHPREMAIPQRTLQRGLKGKRTNDVALKICAMFVQKLPNKPTVFHALGEALYAVYGKQPDHHIAGAYEVSAHETVLSTLTIITPRVDFTKFLFVKEVTTSNYRRIYDGVLIFTGTSILAILKDRLMNTARVHALHLNTASKSFYGIVYDNGPLERGGVQYQTLQTSVVRTGHAQ